MVFVFMRIYISRFAWLSVTIFNDIANNWVTWIIWIIRVNNLSCNCIITWFYWNIRNTYFTTIVNVIFSDLFFTYFIAVLVSNNYFIAWFYTAVIWKCNINGCFTMIIITTSIFIIRNFTIMVFVFWKTQFRWSAWLTSKIWIYQSSICFICCATSYVIYWTCERSST